MPKTPKFPFFPYFPTNQIGNNQSKKPPKEEKKCAHIHTHLVDWWVHGIGAHGALKQFMNAGRRSSRRRNDAVLKRLRRELMNHMIVIEIVMMVMKVVDLLLFHAIRWRYTLDIIQVH